MFYCINPQCRNRLNTKDSDSCQTCGTPLLVDGRYRLLEPLRPLEKYTSTEIFEVTDGESLKVMKILKENRPYLIDFFEREALTLQLMKHPGIPKVGIDDYFTVNIPQAEQEIYCLVMEKIEGKNLEQWVKEYGKISQSQALSFLKELILILKALHKNHFFHRDIKPSNIILKPDGKLVLIDFGSVRAIQETYLAKVNLGNVTTVVSSGYTPLEQIEGRAVPQSDFYALGRTFVHLLTGKHPSELPINSRNQQLIWRNQAPQISGAFADLIDEFMAFSPVERPQNTEQILPYLNIWGLLIKQIQRFISSPKFKLVVQGTILISMTTGILYQFLFLPRLHKSEAQKLSEQSREYLVKGNLDQARKLSEKAVSLDPKNAVYRNDLGLICKYQDEFDCATKQYKKAIELESNLENSRINYLNLGILQEDKQQFDQALESYRKAMEDPEKLGIRAVNNYTRLLIWYRQDHQLAIKLLSQSIKKNNEQTLKYALLKNLGWAYFQAGDEENARQSLTQAIKIDDSKQAAAYCLLAKIEQERDRYSALKYWGNCRDYVSNNLPEVKTWQLDAKRYLNQGAE